MKNKSLFAGAGIFLICIIAFWKLLPKQQLEMSVQSLPNNQEVNLGKNVLEAKAANSHGSSDNTTFDKDNAAAQLKAQPLTQEQFKSWLSQQAQSLEAEHTDPRQIENTVREQVRQLSAEQKNELVKTVLDRKTAISERIFANYAVALEDINSESASQALERARQIIVTPVPKFVNPAPHTLEETQRGQEYALRYMQIDRLAQAIKDGDEAVKKQSLRVLQSIVTGENDQKIKAYAQQKIKEIRG